MLKLFTKGASSQASTGMAIQGKLRKPKQASATHMNMQLQFLMFAVESNMRNKCRGDIRVTGHLICVCAMIIATSLVTFANL